MDILGVSAKESLIRMSTMARVVQVDMVVRVIQADNVARVLRATTKWVPRVVPMRLSDCRVLGTHDAISLHTTLVGGRLFGEPCQFLLPIHNFKQSKLLIHLSSR